MTDYDMLMEILTKWIDPERDDADDYYVVSSSTNGSHWVAVYGEGNQAIEFDFNPEGKITGWY